MNYARENLKWNGWGWADRKFDLEGKETAFWDFLKQALGLDGLSHRPSVNWEDVQIPSARLSSKQVKVLEKICVSGLITASDYQRIFHAIGRSYRDLLAVRAGTIEHYPDLIAYPASRDELVNLVAFGHANDIVLVPYGGGSSVVGGVEALSGTSKRPVITVDLLYMNKLIFMDEDSQLATAEAGIYGPELEASLQSRGYSAGHFPQSFEFSTLGGWIAARGAGQQSNGYGAMHKIMVSANMVTPTGSLQTLTVPNASSGPDLAELVVGSEGVLGIISDATIKIHPKAKKRDFRGYFFRSFEAGCKAVQEISQSDVPVSMLRLSDPDETKFLLQFRSLGESKSTAKELLWSAMSLGGYGDSMSLLLLGVEGQATTVASSVYQTGLFCVKHGGIPVGTKVGDNWYRNRFEMPYLRDPLLAHGCGVDTLETATTWSNLGQLYRVVQRAIRDAIFETLDGCFDSIVMCHVSHSYHDGGSLYFTFVFPQKESEELPQWLTIKKAASAAIRASGGTISHHHGIGVDHMPWMRSEISPMGITILEGIKDTVDPKSIMNPGKLIPREK